MSTVELLWGLKATIDQVAALDAKIVRLRKAHRAATEQAIHRLGQIWKSRSDHDAEDYRFADAIYLELYFSGLGEIDVLWEEAGLPSSDEMEEAGWIPRAWRSFDGDAHPPPRGVCVVYILFDQDNLPCYVGSTKDLRVRLKQHRKNGKPTRVWMAHECRDRADAYKLEDRLLKEKMPYLNIRRGA